MAYFKPDERKILNLIKQLTIVKPSTNQNELYQEIPRQWKLSGCGTGNLQNILIELHRKNLIATLDDKSITTENTQFYLTEKGINKLKPWYLTRRVWVFIFMGITALSTFGTFLYSILKK